MTHCKSTLSVFVCCSFLTVSVGCDDKEAEGVTAEVKAPASSAAVDEAKVSVSAEGTKFDPPIDKDQLPEGVWYCDMNTVHYASQRAGDGKCPTCGMKLKKFEHDHAHGDDHHDNQAHGDQEHAH